MKLKKLKIIRFLQRKSEGDIMTKEKLLEIRQQKANERYVISKAPFHAALDPAYIIHEDSTRSDVADWLRDKRKWAKRRDERSFLLCGNLWTFEQIDESNPLADGLFYLQRIVESSQIFDDDYAADIEDDGMDFAEVASASMHEEFLNDK